MKVRAGASSRPSSSMCPMGPEPSQRQRAVHLVGSTAPPAAEVQARAVRSRKHRHAARGRGAGESVLHRLAPRGRNKNDGIDWRRC